MEEGGRIKPPRAVVVGVGDELLYGQTVNTNGAWLGQALSDLGFKVVRVEAVGDVEEEIRGAVARGLDAGEVVLITGGLGPTPDDLTRPAVAGFLGLSLREDPSLAEALLERFRARGYDVLPPNNRLMAQVPLGAVVLPNPVGAAPGLLLSAPAGKHVLLLPGIPGEMKGVFLEGVLPFLKAAYDSRLLPVRHRLIHTTGIPESLLARQMAPLLPRDMGPVSLAYLPDMRGLRIRLTAEGVVQEEAEARFDALEERLEELLLPFRFRAESGDLAQALGDALKANGTTLAIAESCTGGLVSKRITDVPGASGFFLGGIVAYSNEVKVRRLGIPLELLEREGAVSREVAEAMAEGVAEGFGAAAGIGVTGIAGPGGGTQEKPVGTVWYAAALAGRTLVRGERFLGDREMVRERAAQASLALLLDLLEGRGP